MHVIVNGYNYNGKNSAIAIGLCAVFVVSWWRNKGLHTLNCMHNEVWGYEEIKPNTVSFGKSIGIKHGLLFTNLITCRPLIIIISLINLRYF